MLLKGQRRKPPVPAHPFLQHIDEWSLLVELGIPSIGRSDEEGDNLGACV
jgi:hypothetical protein